MKINWGTGLVIGMLAFVSFIMYFVVTMLSSSDYDHDLVVEDYYKEELHYQQDIDAERNAFSLNESVEIIRKNAKLILEFPKSIDLQNVDGEVLFYRPSNKKLDFRIPFSEIKASKVEIPETSLVRGRWNVKVSWKQGDREFLFRKEILY